MTELEVKLYLNEQVYNELIQHGYVFLETEQYSRHYGKMCYKDNIETYSKNHKNDCTVSKKFPKNFVEEEYSYFINADYNIETDDSKQFIKKIQIQQIHLFLKTHPELYDTILSSISKMYLIHFVDLYQEYFDAVGINKKSFISHFHRISLTHLSINFISTKQLVKLANEHKLDEIETQDLLCKFYKKRANQVRHPNIGLALRDDLLSYFDYSEEKLSPYFAVFPMLEQYFKTSGLNTTVNIFEQEYPYCAYVQINYITMFKGYLIRDWSKNTYRDHISDVIEGICSYYKIARRYVFSEDGKNSLMNVMILHDNPHFNQDLLKHDFVHFFQYLYKDPTFVINKLTVSTWLTQFYLDKMLKTKDTTIVKKNKL